MKHGVCSEWGDAYLIERAACAARFRGELGKGNASPEVFALILGHPGKPIFRETGAAGAGDGVYANWLDLNMRLAKTLINVPTRVEFPTAARLRACEAPHARRRGKLLRRSSPLNEGSFSV